MLTSLVAVLGIFATDDANWVSFGGAGAFVPHKTIRMLGEDINIVLYDDKIHVRVYFSFQNKGEATKVKMGFPFEGTGYDDAFILHRFATKVDGEAVPVEKVKIAPITRNGKEFLDEGYEIAQPFALVKEVPFDKDQRRTVIVDYVVKRGFYGIGGVADSYVLHTGATWAGRIGQCTITVDWTNQRDQGKPDLEFEKSDYTTVPSQWSFTGPRTATTTLTDFEPDFDLSLSSIEHFGHVTLNGETLGSVHGMAIHDPSFSGPASDPLILAEGLYDFFSTKYSDERKYIVGKVANAFGNSLELVGANTLKDGLGRRLHLKRSAVSSGQYDERVRLKDVVLALGGTFKWSAEMERIDITMPTRDTPTRQPEELALPLRS